jgi:cell wall-associated NlpC family hydrolase
MKRKFKYLASVAVMGAMMQTTPTFASPIDSHVTKEQINATQGQINDFETKIQKLDNQITVAMDKSQKLNDKIKAEQGKIEATKAEIEKAKKALDAHKMVYSERLKSIQSDGQQPIVTYAELLFSSKDISDFLTRFTAISEIIQSDTDLLNGLNEKEQALKDAGDKLHNELDNLKKSQAELASEQKKIEADKQEVVKELAKAKNNLHNQQAQLAQQQAQEKAQQEALLAQQRAQQQAQARQRALLAQQQQQAHKQSSASKPTVSASASSLSNADKANKVIAYAEQFLGTPYVWGGTSPSGFDCSGFMQYVFRSVGVDLPRVAADQQNVGTRISPDQVQPGDLVFKGDPAYHVGMYIGGGKWIQSPETGDVVKISNYNPASFSSAARVLQ